MSIFISNVEVDSTLCSVLIEGDRIAAIGTDLVRPTSAHHIDAEAGMLLPGLHDHHVHLLSLAASLRSVDVGASGVRTIDDLRRVLRDAASSRGGEWIRAVGYHESIAGELDRDVLDQIVTEHPLRVQHRSGAMWFLNSLALERSGLSGESVPGLELDDVGRPTGRLFRGDRTFEPDRGVTVDDLRALSDTAARRGVTGFTDATPNQNSAGVETLVHAHQVGALGQRLTLMTPLDVRVPSRDGVDQGPVKVLLDDVDLPALDDLAESVAAAHRAGRAVAIHCVTDLQTVLAFSAINLAGPGGGDRIEHGAVMPTEFDELARALRVTVVTQPHFILERGDDYLREVPEQLHAVLYRAQSLIDAGVALAAGTDAPFGSSDPWVAMDAATRRTTRCGHIVAEPERLNAKRALTLFTGAANQPGRPRRIEVGSDADLCLLALGGASTCEDLSSRNVRATIIAGRVAFER